MFQKTKDIIITFLFAMGFVVMIGFTIIHALLFDNSFISILIAIIGGLMLLMAIYLDCNIHARPNPAYSNKDITKLEDSMKEICKKHSSEKR